MDAGTLHPYPGGVLPTSALAGNGEQLERPQRGAQAVVGDGDGLLYGSERDPERVSAGRERGGTGQVRPPHLYLDYFNAGICHTSIYEIADEQ